MSDSGSDRSSSPAPASATVTMQGPFRTFVDENTGRTVRQLTRFPQGAALYYFRLPRHVPGGWMLFKGQGREPEFKYGLIHPDSGQIMPLPHVESYLKLRASDGRLWYALYDKSSRRPREIWQVDLPYGTPSRIAELPLDLPGDLVDITCDGRYLILVDIEQDLIQYPAPTTMDVGRFWAYLNRPRNSTTWTYDLETKAVRVLLETPGVGMFHHDTHPTDPTLLRYALDNWEGDHQRVFSIRIDGSERRPLPPQEKGQLVTHEWWWPDHRHMGYTYQDRRHDPSHYTLPWCEYGLAPTQLGVCDLEGKQVYLSDPVNHYHTHLYTSLDGRFVTGEGTDGHSFGFAAPFSFNSTRIEFERIVTIHTPYVPFRGQMVHTVLSADNRWLLFNDTIDGVHQVCAVAMD